MMTRRFLALTALLFLGACGGGGGDGGGGGGSQNPGGDPGGTVAISVSPSTLTVTPSGTQQFTCTVSGATQTTCTWAVTEAAGGSVTAAGLYTAASAPGTYHLVATAVADTTKKATATITVAPSAAP